MWTIYLLKILPFFAVFVYWVRKPQEIWLDPFPNTRNEANDLPMGDMSYRSQESETFFARLGCDEAMVNYGYKTGALGGSEAWGYPHSDIVMTRSRLPAMFADLDSWWVGGSVPGAFTCSKRHDWESIMKVYIQIHGMSFYLSLSLCPYVCIYIYVYIIYHM